MSLENKQFPISGKLLYSSEEVRLNTLGIYSTFGNTVQSVTDEHTDIPELYLESRLDSFISDNIPSIVKDTEVFTDIDSLIKKSIQDPQLCYKYQSNNIIFIVTPELRSVYQFEYQDETETMIDTYKKTIPINQTPNIRLIGELTRTEENKNTYTFDTKGLRMKLLGNANKTLNLLNEEPAVTFDLYSELQNV